MSNIRYSLTDVGRNIISLGVGGGPLTDLDLASWMCAFCIFKSKSPVTLEDLRLHGVNSRHPCSNPHQWPAALLLESEPYHVITHAKMLGYIV
jgi:hypothetical protein